MWIVALIYSIGGILTFLISGLALLKEHVDFNDGFMNQFDDIIIYSMGAIICGLVWPLMLIGILFYSIGKRLND